MANPYQAPQIHDQTRAAPRWMGLLSVAAWAYPVLLVGSFYATWLAAWLLLGHRPRPSLDDPASISPVVDVFRYVAGFLLVGFPAGILAGGIILLYTHRRRWWIGIAQSGLLMLLWFVAFFLLRSDPWSVIEWYMD